MPRYLEFIVNDNNPTLYITVQTRRHVEHAIARVRTPFKNATQGPLLPHLFLPT